LETVNNAIIFGAIQRGARFFNYGEGEGVKFRDGIRARKSTQNLNFGFPSMLFWGTNIAGADQGD